jgi:hypothetical protein
VTDKKSSPLVAVLHKSPRDFEPWKLLMPFYDPIRGLYMYQQAGRQIADADDWDDSKLEALLDEMAMAINSGALRTRSRKTGAVIPIPPNSPETVSLVTVDDVNKWLTLTEREYRWKLQTIEAQHHAYLPSQVVFGQAQFEPLTTSAIAQLFDGLPFATNRWPRNLSTTKWLKSAMRGQGERGGASATWCPLTIAQLVYGHEKDIRAKQKTFETLNSRFRTNPILKPWKDAWDDFYGTFTEPGEV